MDSLYCNVNALSLMQAIKINCPTSFFFSFRFIICARITLRQDNDDDERNLECKVGGSHNLFADTLRPGSPRQV